MGLTPSYTPDDLKRNYRKLSLRHHPDKGGTKEKFQELQNAYETLVKILEEETGEKIPFICIFCGQEFNDAGDSQEKPCHCCRCGESYEKVYEWGKVLGKMENYPGYFCTLIVDGYETGCFDEVKKLPNCQRQRCNKKCYPYPIQWGGQNYCSQECINRVGLGGSGPGSPPPTGGNEGNGENDTTDDWQKYNQTIAKEQIEKLFTKSKIKPSDLDKSLWNNVKTWQKYLLTIQDKAEIINFVERMRQAIKNKLDANSQTRKPKKTNSDGNFPALPVFIFGVIFICLVVGGAFLIIRSRKISKKKIRVHAR
nr:DnaJ domain-containing protein [endosymbiont GvMRE of Glomus versiforme]